MKTDTRVKNQRKLYICATLLRKITDKEYYMEITDN